MALKSKRPADGARRGKNPSLALPAKPNGAGAAIAAETSPKQRSAAAVETIEARLVRKAAAADTGTSVTQSLGQMTVEQRHKLLYGD